MVYIFTNVWRFRNDGDFVAALKSMGLDEKKDVMVFLNRCIPFTHARDFFSKFKLVTVSRKCSTKYDSAGYFGYAVAKGIAAADVTRYRAEGECKIIDENGDVVMRLEYPEYTSGKSPTTGYVAAKLFDAMFPSEKVVLVNYYGDDDSSTGKSTEHDWKFENAFIKGERQKEGRCIFVEPPKGSAGRR